MRNRARASVLILIFFILALILTLIFMFDFQNHNFIYVGMTKNLEERLRRHNAGYERSTKHYAPFDLIYSEEQETRPLARKREKYWKSGIGKEKLRQMIANKSAGLSTDR